MVIHFEVFQSELKQTILPNVGAFHQYSIQNNFNQVYEFVSNN